MTVSIHGKGDTLCLNYDTTIESEVVVSLDANEIREIFGRMSDEDIEGIMDATQPSCESLAMKLESLSEWHWVRLPACLSPKVKAKLKEIL